MDLILEYISKAILLVSLSNEILKYYRLYHGKSIRIQRTTIPIKDKFVTWLFYLLGVVTPAGVIIYIADRFHGFWDWVWLILAILIVISNIFVWLIIDGIEKLMNKRNKSNINR